MPDENGRTRREGTPFEGWGDAADAAVAVAQRHAEPYRGFIIQGLLSGQGSAPTGTLERGAANGKYASELSPGPKGNGADPVEAAAVAAGVSADALRRMIEINPDRSLEILARIDGDTKKARQLDYSVVYLFVKEKGMGEAESPSEELRNVVERQGAYSKGNFARYFSESDLVLARGPRNSPAKHYRLTGAGERRAVAVLRDLAGDE